MNIPAKYMERFEKDKAHWIKLYNPNYSPFDGGDEHVYLCSHCEDIHAKQTLYCPDCGYPMSIPVGLEKKFVIPKEDMK